MSTRLNLENYIKSNVPEIKRVKVYSHKKGSFTIYAEESNGLLSNEIYNKINNLDYPAHLLCEIKTFNQIYNSNVPKQNIELPEEVIVAATYGEINKQGIKDTIQRVFPHINLISMDVSTENGFIYFNFSNDLTTIERSLLNDYLEELTPVDFNCEIIHQNIQ